MYNFGGGNNGGGEPRFITNQPAERAGARILNDLMGFFQTFSLAGVGDDVFSLFFMQNPG